jgi:V8-like Glu-specific endopeptidase
MPDAAGPVDESAIVEAVTDLVRNKKILVPDFREAFDRRRSIEKQTPSFDVLLTIEGGELNAIRAALRKAMQDGFFAVLFSSLVGLAPGEFAEDPRLKEIPKYLAESQPIGSMQSVLRATGFRAVATLPSLVRAAQATALIQATRAGTTAFGTGFLVAPSLLLTASHVIEPLLENGAERSGAAGDASIQFHNQLEAEGHWPYKLRLAPSNWLVSISPPNGKNGALAQTSAQEAAQKLDFALLRLADVVSGAIEPVDIKTPPEPEENGRLTVMGYQGGSECFFDDRLLRNDEVSSCRIRYDANTADGMSGGPCIDSRGRAVALHEGTIKANPEYNRAINLGAVRRWMQKAGADPLLEDAGMLRSVQDREARRAWIAAGERLLGSTPGERQQWLNSVVAFNPDDTRGGVSPDIFHPVFGRKDFQEWIDRARLAASGNRIALLSGNPGSGRTFCATILRHRLRAAHHHVIVTPQTVIGKPAAEILEWLLAQVTAQSWKSPDERLRPMAGVLRRDALPDTFSVLKNAMLDRFGAEGILWLFADVEDSTLTPDQAENWKLIMGEAGKHPFVRFIAVGLSNAQRGEFVQAAEHQNDILSRTLSPITSDEFSDYIAAQAESFHLKPQEWTPQGTVLWDKYVEPYAPQEGRSVRAVRLALEIRVSMLSAAEPGHA